VEHAQSLSALLLSLFGSSGPLERFARLVLGRGVAAFLEKNASAEETARAVARAIEEYGRIDPELFARLREEFADRVGAIDRVEAEILGEAPDGAPAVARPVPVPEGLEEWADQLQGALPTPPPPDARGAEVRWLEAASVLLHFDPLELKPLLLASETPDLDLRNGPLTQLAPFVATNAYGRWELLLPHRRRTLRTLWEQERVRQALDANPDEASPQSRLLGMLADGAYFRASELATLQFEGRLSALQDVVDWLGRSLVADRIDLDLLQVLVSREERIRPLRRLAGDHFRGRSAELGELAAHVAAESEPTILVLTGTGGVGKSALLGKFLLDHQQTDRPWVYLDFDDPEVESLEEERWIEAMARQLAELSLNRQLSQALTHLESAAASDGLFSQRTGATLEELADQLAEIAESLPPEHRSLLLVFDTFEVVQTRGQRAVRVVRDFIDQLSARLVGIRFIVSGRGTVEQWSDAKQLALRDLDRPSADAVLEALGIEQERLRERLIDSLGTNPLSLRLAAEAVASRQLSEEDLDEFALVVRAQQGNLQGKLYARILGRIRDERVRRLAHPGLIVRRVTPDVIREVLAGPCGLDPEDADALFLELQSKVPLFERSPDDPGALLHRQDVREAMLRLMFDDPLQKSQIEPVHRNAVAFYEGGTSRVERAERIYHGLMLDEHPDDLDAHWDADLSASLGRSWGDPFPERARLWLGARIGRTQGDSEGWRTADWEIVATRDAAVALQKEDPLSALELLRARSERTPASPVHRLESRALLALGRLDEAEEIVERGIASAKAADRPGVVSELLLVQAEIARARRDRSGVEKAARLAADLAEQTAQSRIVLEARSMLVDAARESGVESEARHAMHSLTRSFLKADDEFLHASPDLVGQVVRAAGSDSAGVLRKAALAVGNYSDQALIKPDAIKLGTIFGRILAVKGASEKLAGLADRVGLSSQFEPNDLAYNVVRFNRMGDAIASVLDEAGDDATVRMEALEMFELEG